MKDAYSNVSLKEAFQARKDFLNEELKSRIKELRSPYVSWVLKTDIGCAEAFWVSYCEDGRICGEHAF